MENKKKILIIEDDDSNRRILEMAVSKIGCQVHAAPNGEEGLRLALEIKPSLILMDVMMPKLGGIETLREIRKSPGIENVPVIVISAKAGKADAELALKSGANEFVTKPFRVKGIMEIISKYLGEK